MNVLMPMAGEGLRLKNFADIPKPLINIGGYPIFMWALHNMPSSNNFIFVVKDDHVVQHSIQSIITKTFKDAKVIAQRGKVDGAVKTTLLVEDLIDNDEPLIIVDCDVFVNIDFSAFHMIEDDGAIVVSQSQHKNLSYVEIDGEYVTKVAEKEVISDIAVAGVYFWKKGSDYVKYAKSMIKKEIKTNGEFYIAPVYNEAIADNKKIKILPTEVFYHLGSEEEIKKFTER